MASLNDNKQVVPRSSSSLLKAPFKAAAGALTTVFGKPGSTRLYLTLGGGVGTLIAATQFTPAFIALPTGLTAGLFAGRMAKTIVDAEDAGDALLFGTARLFFGICFTGAVFMASFSAYGLTDAAKQSRAPKQVTPQQVTSQPATATNPAPTNATQQNLRVTEAKTVKNASGTDECELKGTFIDTNGKPLDRSSFVIVKSGACNFPAP